MRKFGPKAWLNANVVHESFEAVRARSLGRGQHCAGVQGRVGEVSEMDFQVCDFQAREGEIIDLDDAVVDGI